MLPHLTSPHLTSPIVCLVWLGIFIAGDSLGQAFLEHQIGVYTVDTGPLSGAFIVGDGIDYEVQTRVKSSSVQGLIQVRDVSMSDSMTGESADYGELVLVGGAWERRVSLAGGPHYVGSTATVGSKSVNWPSSGTSTLHSWTSKPATGAVNQNGAYGWLSATQKQIEVRKTGDLDGNGVVDFQDFLLFTLYFENPNVTITGFTTGDFDLDGDCDFTDWLLFSDNYPQ